MRNQRERRQNGCPPGVKNEIKDAFTTKSSESRWVTLEKGKKTLKTVEDNGLQEIAGAFTVGGGKGATPWKRRKEGVLSARYQRRRGRRDEKARGN